MESICFRWFILLFFSGADGQKRKKSLRRKLDSLAKEKSKDKGTPSSFNVHSDILPLHEGFSPPVSSCFVATLTSRSPASEPEGQSVVSAPPGQVNSEVIKTQFLFTGLWLFIFSLSEGTPCKGTGSEKQPLCGTKRSIFGRKRKGSESKEPGLQRGAGDKMSWAFLVKFVRAWGLIPGLV